MSEYEYTEFDHEEREYMQYDYIERAREAQQKHDAAHDVQLEIEPGSFRTIEWASAMEVREHFRSYTLAPWHLAYDTYCMPHDCRCEIGKNHTVDGIRDGVYDKTWEA